MHSGKFSVFFFSMLFLACSKGSDNTGPKNRELSPLGKRLIGKWWLISPSANPGDFWEFKDVIIDSISNDSVTYRQYTDSVKVSLCNRLGRWYEKDSVLYGTCVPNAKITKLTDDTLIFRYFYAQYSFPYVWKRAK